MRGLVALLFTVSTVVAVPGAAPVEARQEGRIVGRVEVPEESGTTRPARYYRGPYRGGQRAPEGAAPGGPGDVVVRVEGVSGDFAPPEEPVAMVQRDERFVPHVLPVLSGTTVSFPNHDPYYHNVFSIVGGDRFDLGRYAGGESGRQTLVEPGVVVVRCEIHPRMKAFVLVVDNPYFASPDATGAFEIGELPPGTYTLTAWHPTRGERQQTVTVPEGGEARVTFAF